MFRCEECHLRAHLALAGASFNLDFHAVPFFGRDEFVERHYLSKRSRRDKAVLTFMAQDANSDVLCYANADLRKGEESDEVLRFVDFWKKTHGQVPPHLVFDSKLTTYRNLSRMGAQAIIFVTLRRRTDVFKRHVLNAPATTWRPSLSPGGEELRSRSRSPDRRRWPLCQLIFCCKNPGWPDWEHSTESER
ncbi:hypothetical protein [Sorangium sp. So ce887]|uniref:hypothetical protein n=1 Tax=Sorangium sp. So ce887 TaxID=3133324 RepID=UPI003F60E743